MERRGDGICWWWLEVARCHSRMISADSWWCSGHTRYLDSAAELVNKSYDVSTQDGSHRAGLGTTLAVMSSCSHFTMLTPSPDQSTSGDSSPSEAVTPRERGNERHDVLARHTDTCHVSRVRCQVSWRRTLCKNLNCTANAEHCWPHSHWFVHPLTLDLYSGSLKSAHNIHSTWC